MKKVKNIIRDILFVILLVCCINCVYQITKRKISYYRRMDFTNQEENFDVLFFGSSHMGAAVFPSELWRDFGIVSYNLAQSSERIPTSYWALKLSLLQTNPKLVVIDTYAINRNEKVDIDRLNLSLDSYPLSYTKIKAILDLNGKDNLIKYALNFSLYHSRWNVLTKSDFVYEYSYPKGCEYYTKVANADKMSDYEDVAIKGKENVSTEYLRKFIRLCKQKGIQVLVVYMPYPATDSGIGWSKYVEKICIEEEADYINFLKLDLVNYDTDVHDANQHLNVSGARKVTDFLGKYIVQKYNIEDHRNNSLYSFLYTDYDKYIDYKISLFKQSHENLNSYLVMLYDNDFTFDIKIKSTVDLKSDSKLKYLLNNLNNKYEISEQEFEGKSNNNIKITVYDNRNNEKVDEVYFEYK